MATSHLDAAARRLATGIGRRALFGGLAALAGGLGLVPGAAKRRKKGKKGNRKRGPALRRAAGCDLAASPFGAIPFSVDIIVDRRAGQGFQPAAAGVLRRIAVEVRKEEFMTPGDWVVQLVTADTVPTLPYVIPSHLALDVLAAGTVPDASVPFGFTTIAVAVDGPRLDPDQLYAVVVSRPGSNAFGVITGDVERCGQFFVADGTSPATGFQPHPETYAMKFAVFVA